MCGSSPRGGGLLLEVRVLWTKDRAREEAFVASGSCGAVNADACQTGLETVLVVRIWGHGMNRVRILSLPCQGAGRPSLGCLGESLGHFDFLWTPRWVFCGLIRRVSVWPDNQDRGVLSPLSGCPEWNRKCCHHSEGSMPVLKTATRSVMRRMPTCLGQSGSMKGHQVGDFGYFYFGYSCWVTWANEEPCGPTDLFALAMMQPAFASHSLVPSRK